MKTVTCTTNHKLNINETPTKDIVMIQSVSPTSVDNKAHYIFIHKKDIDPIINTLLLFKSNPMKTKTTKTKKATKKVAAKKPASKPASKAANRKPADRKAAPRKRVEAVITEKEHAIIKKAAHRHEMTITELVKNWIKSLLK